MQPQRAPLAGPAHEGSPGPRAPAPPLGLLILHVGDEPAAGTVRALQKPGEQVRISVPPRPLHRGAPAGPPLLLILRPVQCGPLLPQEPGRTRREGCSSWDGAQHPLLPLPFSSHSHPERLTLLELLPGTGPTLLLSSASLQ